MLVSYPKISVPQVRKGTFKESNRPTQNLGGMWSQIDKGVMYKDIQMYRWLAMYSNESKFKEEIGKEVDTESCGKLESVYWGCLDAFAPFLYLKYLGISSPYADGASQSS